MVEFFYGSCERVSYIVAEECHQDMEDSKPGCYVCIMCRLKFSYAKSFGYGNGKGVHRDAYCQKYYIECIHYLSLLRVNSLNNSLKARTANESPITVHHCPEVIGASLKRDCIPGTRRTINVSAVTNTIVSQSHLLVNILWVNQLCPDLMLKMIVN